MLTRLGAIPRLCEVPRADGAFYFLLRIPAGLDSQHLCEQLIMKHKVATIPGNAFGARGCRLRIAYGSLTRETACVALDRLIEGLRSHAGQYRSGESGPDLLKWP